MDLAESVILTTDENKAKYDATIKQLLSLKPFLSRIMKHFVPEFSDLSLKYIETDCIEPGSIHVSDIGVAKNTTNVIEGISNEDTSNNEGKIYYDIIFRACYPGNDGKMIGIYINLEAQNAYHKGYPIEKRGMFYAARRLSSQLRSINNETNYGMLEKVYSIWLCMGNDVPMYESNTVSLYRTEKCDIIGSVKRNHNNYDMMNVIIMRINDTVAVDDEVLKLLQIVCSNLTSKEEKLAAVKDAGITDENVEKEVNTMCNMSDLVEKRGEERGEMKKAKNMALEMLRDGMSYDKVAKYAGVSVETLQKWEIEACCIS